LKVAFSEITRKTYVDQAKWFLNGFWDQQSAEAETVWNLTHKFIELDPKKKAGNELDEFWSHKFLESLGETLTVIQLRDKLRKIDLDANGKMSSVEYFCFKYSKSIQQIIDAPQGSNQKELQEATERLDQVTAALVKLQKDLDEQKTAVQLLTEKEAEAKSLLEQQAMALAAQKTAEEAVRKAEAELKAIVDELKAQEEAKKQLLAGLEAKSKDEKLSQVNRSKAAAELAQAKQEDSSAHQKAKITQEAALRKVENQRKAQEVATQKAIDAKEKAEQQKKEVERAKRDAEEKARAVEAAVKEAETKFQEAQEALEIAKKKGGTPMGAIWWMERELKEAKKYLPKSKQ